MPLFGCASYGSHLVATPLPKGANEVSLNADALLVDRGFGPQILPNPEVGLRRGVAHGLDLGGRLNAGTLELDGRFRVVQTSAFALSVVPGLGAGFVPVTNNDTGLCNANLLGAVLGGFQLGQGDELVLGPRLISSYAFPATAFRGDFGDARFVHALGGTLGARFFTSDRVALSPAFNFLLPYDTRRNEWLTPAVQGGLAIQFGRRLR